MAGFDESIVNGIRVLAAIIDSGTFAAAADILQMSQSGVSRAIARLEARLGIRLLERTTRSISLTDEGRRFYEQVAPLLAGLAEAVASAAQGTTAIRGVLRVNIDPYFSRLVLGPHLGAFLETYPQVKLELITRDELGDPVADGFDLAVRFGHPRPSTLIGRKLLDTRMLTVASPGYLKRHGHPKDPRELATGGHVCILFRDSATGRPFPWEFHRRGKKLVLHMDGALTVNDAGTLYSVCLAGHGMAQVMDLGAEPMLADGRLVNVFPEWRDEQFPLYAFHPSRHHLPAKTRAFLDFIVGLLQ
ncbi:DNA-binding transcriptional LysR family regulator [Variovorax beijingensis]|jgi:Transcriptional regulator|uniref:DNA-binding transcriptional LysR family regulator n=2 Tax=Variovorax TaxID=34072 RepID=A0AAE3Y4Y5_VARPD|nr:MULTISPECIES: LysR family transcriptional regulator [Variovorax]MDP9968265.1 DNA-binding transcriptional LysR family regulator [Variovorax paradoxus]MDR6429659.1 DNA-binding transcriptional LysR family regulator [Variovorax paradoxus]MDR6456041.1 DNA-binding transcriptional LysR family regulator [Variovorax paradoxus]TWD72976.1 DNA-binding transcriptional LysR family regulator [Variovorax beijingensis]